MRTPQNAHRALYWRLDPEHEAFRGLGARSAARLGWQLSATENDVIGSTSAVRDRLSSAMS